MRRFWSVKWAVLVVCGMVLVGGLVFGWMMLAREKLDYVGAGAYVRDMLGTEEVVMSFLGVEEVLEGKVGEFDEKVGRFSEYYKSLGASSALKDEEVGAKYDALAGMAGKLVEMRVVAVWLMELQEILVVEGFAGVEKIEGVPNDFTKEMLEEMTGHLVRVKEFREKYGGGTAEDYNAMTEEYGVILAEGEAMQNKYAMVSLKDVVGVSVEEVRGWFGDLREMEEILEERK